MKLVNREFIIIFLLLGVSLLHWPFIFENLEISNRITRYTLIIILLSIICTRIKTINIEDIFILSIFTSVAFLQSILNTLNFENIAYFYSKIAVIYLLWIYLRQASVIKSSYLEIWKIFSYIIFIFSILVFIFHTFTTFETDFLGIESILNPKRVSYSESSIFGISQEIYYRFGISGSIHRVTSYFNEPGDLSFFCIVNLLIIKNINSGRIFNINSDQKVFTILTTLTGLLCFSATFYIILFILVCNDLRKSLLIFLFILIVFSIYFLFYYEVIIFYIADFFTETSLVNRLQRFQCGIEYFNNANIIQLFFGHGVLEKPCFILNPKLNYEQVVGFSTGYNIIGIQYGMMPLIITIFFSYLFLKHSYLNLFIYFLCFFAISWSLQYIFIYGMIATYLSAKRID